MSFTLYTTTTCGFCNQLKKVLGMKNAKYETVDITDDYEKRLELQKKYGAVTVPILVREDGEFVVGYNLQKTMSLL